MDSLTGQQLLGKDETVVQADMVLADKKIIAFYFSAHWCPPCRLFTPVLAEFYSVSFMFLTVTILINSECSQDLVGAGESFEIVFVSSDKTPEDQMQYMRESHGDWLAVQHNTVLASQLKKVNYKLILDNFWPKTQLHNVIKNQLQIQNLEV